MDENSIDFLKLDGDPAVIQPGATQEQPASPEPPAAPEAPTTTTEVPAQPAPVVIPPGYVPLNAMLDEREQRQALKKQLDELQKKQQPAKPAPNVTSDPQGWQAAHEQRLAEMELSTKMRMSGAFAQQQFGTEAIDAAKAWGATQNETDPYFGNKFTVQDHPWAWLVEQHRQAQILEQIGGKSSDDWVKERAIALGYVLPDAATQQPPAPAPAAAPQQPAPQRPTPPRSIANAPPAGGTAAQMTIGEKELLGEALFS